MKLSDAKSDNQFQQIIALQEKLKTIKENAKPGLVKETSKSQNKLKRENSEIDDMTLKLEKNKYEVS